MAKFSVPETILTGAGCLNDLPTRVRLLKAQRVMLVTGRTWARKSGLLQRVIDLLKSADIEVEIFEGIPAEPPCPIIDDLRQTVRKNRSELIIGLGGGSVLDAAKAAAILFYSDQPTVRHLYDAPLPDRSLPMIAVATTAGTGSEATPTVVLTDPDQRTKQSFRSEIMMPTVAIVDPELISTCSPGITAISGFDALVQAVEAFCSKFSTNLSDALTEKAIALIGNNLVHVYHDSSDLSGCQALAEGSLMAGMALANVRLGAVHGLAHPIGGRYNIPHGLVCAVLMPTVLEFNRPALYMGNIDKYAVLCNLLMADPVIYFKNLLSEMGLPQDLSEFKIRQEDWPAMADQAMKSGSTHANPRPVTREDFLEILRKVSFGV